MNDDNINVEYDGGHTSTPAPVAVHYYAEDDDWQSTITTNNNGINSENYYSAKATTSWIDKLFRNTTRNVELEAAQDVNSDQVLQTLIFNCLVCATLLTLYELLRRWIPSVYSQAIACPDKVQYVRTTSSSSSSTTKNSKALTVDNNDNNNDDGIKDKTNVIHVEKNGGMTGSTKKEIYISPGALCCNDLLPGYFTNKYSSGGWWPTGIPILEWAIIVHRTPWSTFRTVAGLDAYFYLRYIRMCLKIATVSSFWAIIILCPLYATGGGYQTGFYYFSMANVLPDDKKRVWVPSVFCWAFTMYCWFCVRAEMIHYVDLRMEFLGGEEEELIVRRMRESSIHIVDQDRDGIVSVNELRDYMNTSCVSPSKVMGDGERIAGISETTSATAAAGGYDAPSPTPQAPPQDMRIIIQQEEEDESSSEERDNERSRSRSPLIDVNETIGNKNRISLVPSSQQLTATTCITTTTTTTVQKQMKQHRYSLQVEKIPVALRSNTALFNYFDEIFPGQVHSACIAMNVPDLDALSARRMRVCRRLEKSLAYHSVTGIRPTHTAGRPRFQCCGIESTPIDGWCLILNSFDDPYLDQNDSDYPTEVYVDLPSKGERVDSILYYTRDLANCNVRMKKMQEEKFQIAATGISLRHRNDGSTIVSKANYDWYSRPLAMLKSNAAKAVDSLRDEFEVYGEEDYFGDGVVSGHNKEYTISTTLSGGPTPVLTHRKKSNKEYGSMAESTSDLTPPKEQQKQRFTMTNKNGSLDDEYKLTDRDGHPTTAPNSFDYCQDTTYSTQRRSRLGSNRPYIWFRALLWRMGVDFLANSLEEVRNQTDVVVDSVTRPSMSSTGFVTFKTLTPVTVTTSAPLTYYRNPMKVTVAPEPRDIVWQNVQIDRDISAGRAFVANVLLGLGVLLWSIPLTLIQAWAKVENVAMIPGLEWVGQIRGGRFTSLINGYLPVITLLGLILLLPLIFQWVATSYEKRKTLSGVQNSIVGRYFYYQLANIYITVTAGALWTSLADIIDHPQNLLVILGKKLPQLAGYFISLLLTKTLAGLPMVLLRIGALSRMIFLKSCFNKKRLTQRELNEVYRKQPIYYGWEYPTHFLVIIICFTYACISPLVLPVGSLYFFVALLVYKKQALYVYSPTYESGGKMFPQAVSKTLFALVISQLTFIGYTLIRKGVFQIILLAPLPFLTVFFTIYIQNRYVEPSKKLSLERAVKIDNLLESPNEFSRKTYQQPVLSEHASEPMCDANDSAISEVMENLERLHNQSRVVP